MGLGLQQPNAFWERLMSERSAVILASANKWGRERAALERRQAELQARGTRACMRLMAYGWM